MVAIVVRGYGYGGAFSECAGMTLAEAVAAAARRVNTAAVFMVVCMCLDVCKSLMKHLMCMI